VDEFGHQQKTAPALGVLVLDLDDGLTRALVPHLDPDEVVALVGEDLDDDVPGTDVLPGVSDQFADHDLADEVVGDPEFAEPLGQVAARQRGRTVGRLQHQGRRLGREKCCGHR
jgi:hypothetical protein